MFGYDLTLVSLVNLELSDLFLPTDSNDHKNLHYNDFALLEDKYSYALDVNTFNIHTRHLDIRLRISCLLFTVQL